MQGFIRRIGFSISPPLSCVLDLLRASAAFFVVIGHVKLVLFTDAPAANWSDTLFSAVNALGHDAVIVFFVLSGFLVGKAALQTFVLEKNSPADYAIDRVTRLYTVLLPALVIGAALDLAMLHIWPDGPEAWIRQRLGVAIFFGNLVALQGIAVPVQGSNGPLWSLAYESWYYVMFPLALLAANNRSRGRGLVWLLLLAACAALVGKDILKYGFVWMIGVAVWPFGRPPLPTALCWILFAAFVATADSRYLSVSGIGFMHDLGIALTTALLINTYRWKTGDRPGGAAVSKPVVAIAAKFFANFSYSVYLYHFPFLVLIATVLQTHGFARYSKADFVSLGVWIGVTALIYVYAYFLFLITESRYHRIRLWLQSVLHRRRSLAP